MPTTAVARPGQTATVPSTPGPVTLNRLTTTPTTQPVSTTAHATTASRRWVTRTSAASAPSTRPAVTSAGTGPGPPGSVSSTE